MPDEYDLKDEHDFKKYKTLEEYSQTLEGNKYFHGLYLKAVNHPIRREILKLVNEFDVISKEELFNKLKETKVVSDKSNFDYNLNYLLKALCIKSESRGEQVFYQITQEGKVIEYL